MRLSALSKLSLAALGLSQSALACVKFSAILNGQTGEPGFLSTILPFIRKQSQCLEVSD
jgi:hypothetical protein